MSLTEARAASPDWKSITLWAAKILLAGVFITAGGAKLAGLPAMVEGFEQLGLGQWFRYVTGALEVLGALLILVPATSVIGALLFCCIMLGAMLAHLTAMPGSPLPALMLFVLSLSVAFTERHRIAAMLATLRARSLAAA